MHIAQLYLAWIRFLEYLFFYLLIMVALAGGAIAFPVSYLSNTNVLIGFCLLPFVFFTHDKPRVNFFYLGVMITMATLAFLYHVRVFYFFALAFYVLFVIEWKIGRVGRLVLFLLVFMSPFFEQVSVIMGFPIRLQLSQCAGEILSFMDLKVHVDGNMMVLDGAVFHVDEACMGLHLLSISMLMGVFILADGYRIHKVQLSWMVLASFFMIVFFLNLISNLFRIALLVSFKISPDHLMHDGIGILCLILYVLVPLYFLCRWMIRQFGESFPAEEPGSYVRKTGKGMLVILTLLMLGLGVTLKESREQLSPSHAQVSLANFEPEHMANGVTKMFNQEILVYVKHIPEFFSGEHTPLICWKGSGYHFEGIRKISISGHEVYSGNLVKDGMRLSTAWWYDNGITSTISQVHWRIGMLKGHPDFNLINVTAADDRTLYHNLQSIFDNKLLTFHDHASSNTY